MQKKTFDKIKSKPTDDLKKKIILTNRNRRLSKTKPTGSSCCGSVVTNLSSIHEDAGSIPGLAQWVKDLALRELWCRSQRRLRSCVVEGQQLWLQFDP